jgi:hypothetical protein
MSVFNGIPTSSIKAEWTSLGALLEEYLPFAKLHVLEYPDLATSTVYRLYQDDTYAIDYSYCNDFWEFEVYVFAFEKKVFRHIRRLEKKVFRHTCLGDKVYTDSDTLLIIMADLYQRLPAFLKRVVAEKETLYKKVQSRLGDLKGAFAEIGS